LRGEQERLLLEPIVSDDTIDETKLQRVARVDQFGRVVELARLRGPDELREVVAAAEVAGVPDARERGPEFRALAGDAQIACERVETIGTVHGQHGDAVLDGLEQILAHGILLDQRSVYLRPCPSRESCGRRSRPSTTRSSAIRSCAASPTARLRGTRSGTT